MSANRALPIWHLHQNIIRCLTAGNRLVMVAPTGSGKSTQVPQMLLEAGLARGNSKIVVLQPRRVAARTLAARVAWERGVPLGGEVGYQVRFDDRTGLGTRICFVTEGVLLRWLQDDRTLSEVGVVLFDEFHERNLLSDVALALVKQLQMDQRPDLKMVVMSATLEAEPVAAYLGGGASIPADSPPPASVPATGQGSPPPPGGWAPPPCPVLVSEGTLFPIEVCYADYQDEQPFVEQAAAAVERIVGAGEPGDILVFMPGMGEINATINALRAARLSERCAFIPLHGDLPPEQQDLAFAPHPWRKIVVATNVAETSVTIDGIRHVVDSGLARIARFDPERGIGTLLIEPISRASADQRKGRAGRTAPGTCWRLWTESGHRNRPERNTPEIQRSDLAEVVLLLHSLGINKAAQFDWLDKPDPVAVERAEKLLLMLGALRPALGSSGPAAPPAADLTPMGRRMLRLPLHPRYSRMLIEAAKCDCVKAAALCAALVSGRDLLMRLGREDRHIAQARELFEASPDSDFRTLMRAYQFARNCNFNVEQCRRYGVHAQVARQVGQTFEQILQIVERHGLDKEREGVAGESWTESPPLEPEPLLAGGAPPTRPPDQAAEPSKARPPHTTASRSSDADEALCRCLLAGFIDQLCVRRDLGTLKCELTEGRQGTLMRESMVQNAPLFVVAAIREVAGRDSENLTLLGLATAVKREWVEEMFPQHLQTQVEHLYDRTHKRVAAVRLTRLLDLVIHHEHQRETDPVAAGRCLAEASLKGYFVLPLFNHEIHQWLARVNLARAALPGLEFPRCDTPKIAACLARAFAGLTLAKEAQAAPLRQAFRMLLAPEQAAWLEELAPTSLPWPDGRTLKLTYLEAPEGEDDRPQTPELQVKLHECFGLTKHPFVCEGRVPVKLWLCAPDGKRLESTCDWPAFKQTAYPKLRPALQRQYPGFNWL